MTDHLTELKRWAETAEGYDLIDAAEIIRIAHEKKKLEDRTRLLRVEADKMVVAHFPVDQLDFALRYLLSHVGEAGTDIRVYEVLIPKSEVHARLTERWWPIGGAR